MLTPQDFPRPLPDSAYSKAQAIEEPGTRRPGQTGHYRSSVFDPVLDVANEPLLPKTTYGLFQIGLNIAPDVLCFGARPWNINLADWESRIEWMTYRQADEKIRQVGSAIMQLDADGSLGSDSSSEVWVGLWMPNRPEWQLVSLGANAYSQAFASFYDTLPNETAQFCVNNSQMRVVFCTANHVPDLLKMAPNCPSIKSIVCVDSFESIDLKNGGRGVGGLEKATVLRQWGESVGVNVFDFDQILSIGQSNLRPPQIPDPDKLCSLCYTSGTTGTPKGAIYTHLTVTSAVFTQYQYGPAAQPGDAYLSYLPLSHCYAYFTDLLIIVGGGSLAYPCGDITRLMEDIQLSKPHMIVAVPRIINRIYSAVKPLTVDAPGLKGALFRKAYATKLAHVQKTRSSKHPVLDKLLFNKVKQALGGRLEYIGCGSASVAPSVLEFMRVMFSLDVVEGYGSTENVGTCTKTLQTDVEATGTVGPPLGTCMVKLIDVPDMEYSVKDKPYPRGHLCVKGTNVIKGYYKDPGKTAELFDDDGWAYTGDIASIDDKGRLKIIDRIKSLLKLAQGEYIALEKVEAAIGLSTWFQQAFVYGDPLKNHLIAFLVVDIAKFAELCSSITGRTVKPQETEQLTTLKDDKRVTQAALNEITRVCKAQNLNSIETPKQVHLMLDVLPADLLTPTLKLKRNVATETFKNVADKLYNEYEAPTVSKL